MQDVRALNELVAKESAFVDDLMAEIGKVIVGQTYMIERILIGLLTGGHVLLEGVPVWPRRSPYARSATPFTPSSRACSSRPIYCLRT